jgi:hemolysin activation/secretion protein
MKIRLAPMLIIGCVLIAPSLLNAQVLGPADAGRVRPEDRQSLPDRRYDNSPIIPPEVPLTPMPEDAKKISLVLKEVRVTGVTAFSPQEVSEIYKIYLNKKVKLEVAWLIAAAITEHYRNAGYFLSRAYVPAQSINKGVLVIKVVEGYIAKIEFKDPLAENYIIKEYIRRILAQKPAKTEVLESVLLRLNDLPGKSFRAVLSAAESPGQEGGVKLALLSATKAGEGTIAFDNFSSKFLGPYEGQASYSFNLLPLQQTTLSGLMSLPPDELKYGTLTHTMTLAPDTTLTFNTGIVSAAPGFTLKALDLESQSDILGVKLGYQWIRQRQENLSMFLGIDGRDTKTDTFDAPLVRDHIRVIRAGLSYDVVDSLGGADILNLTFSQGIAGLGASHVGDPFLSRAHAVPDFTKFEFLASRLQGLNDDWSVFTAIAGQWASAPLYSSEEFGYGGQAFGRAYDPSEITGDHGLAGSLELRYLHWSSLEPFAIMPYAFLDSGIVWNRDISQPPRQAGSSVGFGVKLNTQNGLFTNIGLAWPIGRDPVAPINGAGNPRILLQFSQRL